MEVVQIDQDSQDNQFRDNYPSFFQLGGREYGSLLHYLLDQADLDQEETLRDLMDEPKEFSELSLELAKNNEDKLYDIVETRPGVVDAFSAKIEALDLPVNVVVDYQFYESGDLNDILTEKFTEALENARQGDGSSIRELEEAARNRISSDEEEEEEEEEVEIEESPQLEEKSSPVPPPRVVPRRRVQSGARKAPPKQQTNEDVKIVLNGDYSPNNDSYLSNFYPILFTMYDRYFYSPWQYAWFRQMERQGTRDYSLGLTSAARKNYDNFGSKEFKSGSWTTSIKKYFRNVWETGGDKKVILQDLYDGMKAKMTQNRELTNKFLDLTETSFVFVVKTASESDYSRLFTSGLKAREVGIEDPKGENKTGELLERLKADLEKDSSEFVLFEEKDEEPKTKVDPEKERTVRAKKLILDFLGNFYLSLLTSDFDLLQELTKSIPGAKGRWSDLPMVSVGTLKESDFRYLESLFEAAPEEVRKDFVINMSKRSPSEIPKEYQRYLPSTRGSKTRRRRALVSQRVREDPVMGEMRMLRPKQDKIKKTAPRSEPLNSMQLSSYSLKASDWPNSAVLRLAEEFVELNKDADPPFDKDFDRPEILMEVYQQNLDVTY